MELLHRNLKHNVREYVIYTQAEADREKIEYTYWKEAQPDSWALSDDGYVMEVILRRSYMQNGRERSIVTMSGGKAWTSSKFSYEERKANGSYSYSTNTKWDVRLAKETKVKDVVRAYAIDIVNHRKIDYETLGRMYQPNAEKPAWSIKKLLKGERIQQMVDDEVERLLKDKGITKSLAVDILMEAVEAARLSAKPSDLLRIAQELQELTGLKKDKNMIKTTETIEATSSTIDLIEKESEKIEKVKLQRAVERVDNEA